MFVCTEWALRSGNVAPKFHHVRSFYGVDLCVEDKSDDLGSGSIDQVVPGEIKWPTVVPVGPNGCGRREECVTRFSSSRSLRASPVFVQISEKLGLAKYLSL